MRGTLPVHFLKTSGNSATAALAGLDQFVSRQKSLREGVGQDGAEIEAGFEKTGQTMQVLKRRRPVYAMDTWIPLKT